MDAIDRKPLILLVLADAALDADGVRPGPLAAWFEIIPEADRDHQAPPRINAARLLRIEPAESLPADGPSPPDRVLDRRGHILVPGLVNAHTHLDLTSLGPRPHDPARGFVPWIDMIRRDRPATPKAIEASIRRGAELTLAGGVIAVGDILGAAGGQPCTDGLAVLADSPLRGVGFVEFFGIGNRAAEAIRAIDAVAPRLAGLGSPRLRAGLQPHAPNTVSIPVYRRCVDLARTHGFPLATHLAETPEERRFIAEAAGPQRDLLERLGVWDNAELDHVGRGRRPVAHLAGVVQGWPFLVAHVNDADDAAIETLAKAGTSVAYCPRASEYFGAPGVFGPHRYREMLDAGVNVCLGTDSIVNLDTHDRISVLDDARFLFHRDRVAPRTLIAMMTTRGAAALGMNPDAFRFTPGGELAGLVAVPIRGDQPPGEALFAGNGLPETLWC